MGNFMGNQMKSVMEENMKKQMAFQEKVMKIQLERQLQMQQEMRARMMSQQLAMGRELFNWWAGFYGVAAVTLTAGFMKNRQPALLVPLIPLSFILGYQYDMAKGNKMERIIAGANDILAKEQNMVAIPGAPLTFQLIEDGADKARVKNN